MFDSMSAIAESLSDVEASHGRKANFDESLNTSDSEASELHGHDERLEILAGLWQLLRLEVDEQATALNALEASLTG